MEFRVERARTDRTRLSAFQLRYKVLVEDLGQDIAGATKQGGVVEPADANGIVLVAQVGGEPVGTISLDAWGMGEIDSQRVWNLSLAPFADAYSRKGIFLMRRAVVLADYRRTSAFADLVAGAVDVMADVPPPWFLFTDVAPQSIQLYEQLGFRSYAPHFTYPQGGAGVPMALVLHDLDHLASVGSPVLPAMLRHRQQHDPNVAQFFRELVQGPVTGGALPEAPPIDPHAMANPSPPLAEIPLFRNVAPAAIEKFLGTAQRVEFRTGDRIIEAPAHGTDVYLLRAGFVEVVKESPTGRKAVVTTLGPGDLIGEMSMLIGAGRTAGVIALTQGEMYRFQPARFLPSAGTDAAVLARINLNLAAILAKRLKVTTNLVA